MSTRKEMEAYIGAMLDGTMQGEEAARVLSRIEERGPPPKKSPVRPTR